jgi:4-oxalocrotonate tautomerase
MPARICRALISPGPTQTAQLIGDVTEAVIPFVGEALRNSTWVLVEEIKNGSWGIGGKPFGLPDVRRIQQEAPDHAQSGQDPRPKPSIDKF